MDLLLNDLSLHGQFPDVRDFRVAVGRVMEMRAIAQSFKREIYAHRNITSNRINATLSLFEALQEFPRDQKRALLSWLTKLGPFWEDMVMHDAEHWLQCGGQIVTDTAVGEAAHCCAVGIDRRLVSFDPSSWTRSPLIVSVEHADIGDVPVQNYWIPSELKNALQNTPAPAASWNDLEMDARTRFQRLTFSSDCFDYLAGQPFAPGAADNILSRLSVLNRLLGLIDESGRRTSAWRQLHQESFRGSKAWFSDASAREKNLFRGKMTFPHPEQPGEYLFCSLHGKVNNPPYRIHFAWPGSPGPPLYVTYVGRKLTV